MIKYPYTQTESDIFGRVTRPLIVIKIYSKTKKIWIPIYDTLADTGADISRIPKYIGKLIIKNITDGRELKIKGFVPYSELTAYLHELKVEIARKQIRMPFAIADSDKTLPILGRIKGLDLFEITYNKGKEIIIKD